MTETIKINAISEPGKLRFSMTHQSAIIDASCDKADAYSLALLVDRIEEALVKAVEALVEQADQPDVQSTDEAATPTDPAAR